MSDIDEDSYANLLYHAADAQLLQRQHLEQFIAKYSPTIPRLVLHTIASDELPEMIHHMLGERLGETGQNHMASVSCIFGNGLPYHDDVLYTQTSQKLAAHVDLKRENVRKGWEGLAQDSSEAANVLEQMFKVYPDSNPTSALFPWLFASYYLCRFSYLPKILSYSHSILLLMAKSGCRFDKLSQLSIAFHANTALPPENGYTRVFQRGKSVTLEQLRKELMRRNTSAQWDESWVPQRVNIVAISYRHFDGGSQQRISDRDLQAIHRFLAASEMSYVRFWIDSKLPLTNDGSFERWLTRGVRPYARYFTLVCPSAYGEKKRYWIQMEKHIAAAARGIFFTTEDGVYFKKGIFSYGTLCHKMLTTMVGINGLPPGLRTQDEGKVIQWALGFLGDQESVRLFRVRGPRLDGLCNMEFSESVVMQNITLLIKEHGPLVLPIETGRSWNEDNPLILKGIPDQILILPTWIGFWHPRNPRKVLFLNGTILPQVIYGGSVGLEVTLREKFVKGQKNEVVRKVLKDIPYSQLLQTTFFSDSTDEEGRETTTSENDERRVVTSLDFKGLPLEAIAKQYGLAPELKYFTNLIWCLEELEQIRVESVKDEVQDEPSNTLSEEADLKEVSAQTEKEDRSERARKIMSDLLQCFIAFLCIKPDEIERAQEQGAVIEETSIEFVLKPKMEGMEAVTFPWECDWI